MIHAQLLQIESIPKREGISMLFRIMFIGAAWMVSAQSNAQSLGDELGINLDNPEFLHEFSASFETGLLSASPPVVDEGEAAILGGVIEMYRTDLDATLEFIEGEVRREDRRIERETGSSRREYGFSANIEYAIGQIYLLKGNRRRAEEYFLQAIEKYPAYVAAYARLMEIYLAEENCDLAVTAGRKAVEIGGANGIVFKGLGLCSFLDDNFDAALSAFRVASSFLPNDPSTYYYHAVSALNAGYAQEAAVVLEELIKSNPENSNFYYLQVNAFLADADSDSALETIEIARRKGMMTSAIYFLQGSIYVEKEMPEAAVTAFVSGVEEHQLPEFSTAIKPFDQLSRLSNWEATERYLDSLNAAYEGRLSSSQSRMLQVLRARVLIDSGRPTSGVELLVEVVQQNPNHGDALLALARYYQQQDDFERANIYYERAANEPELAVTVLMEHAQLAADQEDWDSAINLLSRANEVAPPDAQPTILANIRAIERVLQIVD